jgi:two-component system chemotaxis response regulator CheB
VTAKLRNSLRLRERVRHRIGPGWPAAAHPAPAVPGIPAHGLVLAATSTGGPPALEALLTPLPADFPWPIIIAQHMPAAFTGPLARRLDQLCALTVVEVTDPVIIVPGFVYIGHGDADIIVERHAEGLVARSAAALAAYPWHPSADRLVRSAMEVVAPEQLLGVLMTGMGNDGAAAMAALHGAGGRTIAEAEETAVVWGMPGELVKAGGASHVLPLGEIAARLVRLLG